MEKIAVYPGTFDPITLGHLDVIKRGALIFDRVVVGLLKNSTKNPLFNEKDRLALVEGAVEEQGIKNITVKVFSGLAVDFAVQEGAIAMIRGERLVTESEKELELSFNNYILNPDIISISIKSLQEHLHISSSAVRELIAFRKSELFSGYVSPFVENYIKKHFHI
jgi:pantetheine-phosphate adenylyltransferase